MEDVAAVDRRGLPVHFWIVSLLALAWNLFGAYDYLMSRLHNEAYLKMMMPGADPAAMFGFMDHMPLYASLGWGLGVWAGLAGTIAMLMRSRHAITLYLASLLGMVLSFGYQLFLARDVPAGMDSPVIPLLIAAIGVALLVYARSLRAKGILN